MSHFTVLVIVPHTIFKRVPDYHLDQPRTGLLYSWIEQQLAPFDENREVAAYSRACYCREAAAYQAASTLADAAIQRAGLPPLDTLRKQYHNLPDSERTEERWQLMSYPYNRRRKLAAALAAPQPDGPFVTECPNCGGTGVYRSQYPQNVWRWTNAQGQEVGITTGDEILPNLRPTSSPSEFLQGEEAVAGGSFLDVQGLHTEAQSTADAGDAPPVVPQSKVQPDDKGIRSNAEGSELPLRDMRDDRGRSAEGPVRGSQPHDGTDSGPALHSMQRNAGPDERPTDAAEESGEIPGTAQLVTRHLIGGAKWDWWRIGGRWDGAILSADIAQARTTCHGFNFEDANELPRYNYAQLKTLLAEEQLFIPFAVLTPDGTWHEKGKMGWWAIVTDEQDNWHAQVAELYARHADDYGVVVDCHI